MICIICNKLFEVDNPSLLLNHYKVMHPDIIPQAIKPILTNKHIEGENEVHDNKKGTERKSGGEIDEDLIRLTGCGQITHWRFPPNITHCPSVNCDEQFENRSDAVTHYKEKHSWNSIYCYVCEKPFYARYRIEFHNHFKKLHPNAELSFNFKQLDEKSNNEPVKSNGDADKLTLSGNKPIKVRNDLIDKKNLQSRVNKETVPTEQKIDAAEDGIITLSGLNQNTKWKFPPGLTVCPVMNCGKTSNIRSELIEHYNLSHASSAFFCVLCDKPLLLHSITKLRIHYGRIHPNEELPHIADKRSSIAAEPNDIITLKGCGIITKWKFPNTKQCTVINCRENFDTRSDAIAHYTKRHADISILCEICDKPICSYTMRDFDNHQKTHSSKSIKKDDIKQPKVATELETSSKADNAENKSIDDDLITLSGYGRIGRWRFPPKITHCPMHVCNDVFESRHEAINHYKEIHAKNVILCTHCDKPISAQNFRKHQAKQHPKNAANHQNVDIITLTGCGMVTEWTFPRTKECKVRSCREKCNSRSDAMVHYKEIHAKYSILCTLCSKPICAKDRSLFIRHYRRLHPNDKCPIEGANDSKEEPITKIPDSSVSSRKILCPMMNCQHETESSVHLRNHWESEHPHIRFPELKPNYSFWSDDSGWKSANLDNESTHQSSQTQKLSSESGSSLLTPLSTREGSQKGVKRRNSKPQSELINPKRYKMDSNAKNNNTSEKLQPNANTKINAMNNSFQNYSVDFGKMSKTNRRVMSSTPLNPTKNRFVTPDIGKAVKEMIFEEMDRNPADQSNQPIYIIDSDDEDD